MTKEYQKIVTCSNDYCKQLIPEGATHFELEIDYSNCYYESDQPGCKITFYKKSEDNNVKT